MPNQYGLNARAVTQPPWHHFFGCYGSTAGTRAASTCVLHSSPRHAIIPAYDPLLDIVAKTAIREMRLSSRQRAPGDRAPAVEYSLAADLPAPERKRIQADVCTWLQGR